MAQKAVKSIALTIGGTSWKVIEASPNVGASVEDVNVSDFADVQQVNLPHPQPKPGVMALTLADDGTGTPPTVGTVASFVFTTVYTDGTTETTVTKTVSGYMGKADPVSIQVGGERRPAWNCEFRPVGTTTTTSGS